MGSLRNDSSLMKWGSILPPCPRPLSQCESTEDLVSFYRVLCSAAPHDDRDNSTT